MKSFLLRLLCGISKVIHKIKSKFHDQKQIILFISFYGDQISGDPKAFYEDLLESGYLNDKKSVWVNNRKFPIKNAGNELLNIKRKSLRYIYYFSNASIIINNCNEDPNIKKDSKCYYIQTWHGSPIKKIGLDIEDPKFNNLKQKIMQETSMWSLFLSPNSFFTKYYLSAFNLNNEKIFENILPRNYRLLYGKCDFDHSLIDQGVNFRNKILYAPTFRDGYNYMPEIDFLSSEIVSQNKDSLFLIRSHPNVMRRKRRFISKEINKNIIFVQNEYDIHDLFKTADLLITDYSSSLFDYAILGKPIILYVPDLEEYKKYNRGLYFEIIDLKLEIAHSLDELSEKINAIQKSENCNFDFEEFNYRFNHNRTISPHDIVKTFIPKSK